MVSSAGPNLTFATECGHAFIDRELYLPRSWIDNPARCAEAGVPEDTVFKTKPQLAARMIERALDADTPASWVAGDEVYGNDPTLRNKLREQGIGFVLAVARDHRVHTHAGVRRAIDLALTLPHTMWQTRSAGPGSKGHRWYAWALVDVDDAEPGQHRLLIRRNLRTGELAFYRCWSPDEVPPRQLGEAWSSGVTARSAAGTDRARLAEDVHGALPVNGNNGPGDWLLERRRRAEALLVTVVATSYLLS